MAYEITTWRRNTNPQKGAIIAGEVQDLNWCIKTLEDGKQLMATFHPEWWTDPSDICRICLECTSPSEDGTVRMWDLWRNKWADPELHSELRTLDSIQGHNFKR